MRKFISKLCLFLLTIATSIVLMVIFFSYFSKRALKVPEVTAKINTLVIGDSHLEVGINDSLLPYAVNFSQSQEPLFFSYYKIKGLIHHNPSIEHIYLGFSYHSISGGYDEFIYGNRAGVVASRYFFLLPLSEQVTFVANNLPGSPALIRAAILKGFEAVLSETEQPFLGGYHNEFVEVQADTGFIERRIKRQFFDGRELYDYSSVNIDYLYKIRELCEQKNKTLVLVNTPVHPYYEQNIPTKFISKFYSLLKSSDFNFLDLGNIPLDDSSYTPDGDHVSRRGAIITTHLLDEYHKINIQ